MLSCQCDYKIAGVAVALEHSKHCLTVRYILQWWYIWGLNRFIDISFNFLLWMWQMIFQCQYHRRQPLGWISWRVSGLLTAAGKLFQFFAWFSFVGPNSFPYIVHGGDFIKILKRQCNGNINALQLLSKSWRRRKVYTDYFWQALWWSDRARDNFWWGKIQTKQHFPHFPIYSRVNSFFFGSELFIRLSCSRPCT